MDLTCSSNYCVSYNGKTSIAFRRDSVSLCRNEDATSYMGVEANVSSSVLLVTGIGEVYTLAIPKNITFAQKIS